MISNNSLFPIPTIILALSVSFSYAQRTGDSLGYYKDTELGRIKILTSEMIKEKLSGTAWVASFFKNCFTIILQFIYKKDWKIQKSVYINDLRCFNIIFFHFYPNNINHLVRYYAKLSYFSNFFLSIRPILIEKIYNFGIFYNLRLVHVWQNSYHYLPQSSWFFLQIVVL